MRRTSQWHLSPAMHTRPNVRVGWRDVDSTTLRGTLLAFSNVFDDHLAPFILRPALEPVQRATGID